MNTFLSLPNEQTDQATARFVVFPVPYEGTVCFQGGTARGPQAILDVSDQMEHIDEETLCLFAQKGIATLPPLTFPDDPQQALDSIYRAACDYDLFRPGRFPIVLGGEHSITGPLIRRAAEVWPELSILQFDAHSDLRDTFEPGGKSSHACVMRRLLEIRPQPRLVQVGVRSFSELDLVECPEQVKRFITPAMLEDDFESSLTRILDSLTKNVYITFDLDGLDPSIAPGVGTPEPGGLTWRQAVRIIRAVSQAKRVVGADVVETLPLPGQIVTEYVAARLVAKIMTYNQEDRV